MILKNLYGKRQRYRAWNLHLTEGIEDIGLLQSRVGDCVFCRRKFIFIIYKDDGIFASPSKAEIDQAITEIGNKFDIEYQGIFNNYIGVNI